MATLSDNAKDAVEEGADAVNNAIQNAATKASDVTNRAEVAAIDAIDEGRDALESALICSKDAIRANPITAMAVVAAIAYLWGRLKR
ncbi:MAG: hypothetical protein ABI155_14260 [Paralcaligenes sp.]